MDLHYTVQEYKCISNERKDMNMKLWPVFSYHYNFILYYTVCIVSTLRMNYTLLLYQEPKLTNKGYFYILNIFLVWTTCSFRF